VQKPVVEERQEEVGSKYVKCKKVERILSEQKHSNYAIRRISRGKITAHRDPCRTRRASKVTQLANKSITLH